MQQEDRQSDDDVGSVVRLPGKWSTERGHLTFSS